MKLHDVAIGLCSHCFNQRLDSRYVDFEVFWDGPVIERESTEERMSGKVPQPLQAIDDLFLCEPCLKQAADLVGLGDVKAERAELEELRGEVLELRKYRLEAEKRLDAAQTAFEGRAARKPAAKKVAA